jgi:8-oxo-dGTP pyrophosphatase MutT (NUDIX family)
MSTDTPGTPAAPRDAATVVLLRDGIHGRGQGGLEVLLLQRHAASEVLGGAHVFPGGKVDAADAAPALLASLDQTPAALHTALAEPQLEAASASAVYVAALRELFEECAVLLAPGATAAHASQGTALLKAGASFAHMLAELGLPLDTGSLRPWSRWITPKVPIVSHKRFDTRFFLARLPAGQVAQHDAVETTASAWLTPQQALRQYRDGQITLAPPQIMSLLQLLRYATVDAALAATQPGQVPLIEPESFWGDDGIQVTCYPGDARHSIQTRALSGPTRLRHVNRRFCPEGGFDALLGEMGAS